MAENYTLWFLSQHYPTTQPIQTTSYENASTDADVAGFLKKCEQEASRQVLDRIYAFASEAVQKQSIGS